MKKALALTSLSLAAFALPLVSLAAVRNLSDAGSFIIDTINNILVPVLFAVAFIVFLFGAFYTFIVGANNEEVKEKGKNLMLWGLIGFFVMVSVWGLVNILTGSISFGNNTGVTPPEAGGVRRRSEAQGGKERYLLGHHRARHHLWRIRHHQRRTRHLQPRTNQAAPAIGK